MPKWALEGLTLAVHHAQSKGLDVCSKYKRNTCCNSTHMQALRL